MLKYQNQDSLSNIFFPNYIQLSQEKQLNLKCLWVALEVLGFYMCMCKDYDRKQFDLFVMLPETFKKILFSAILKAEKGFSEWYWF